MGSGLVLICDDDPLLTELLEHRLGQRGYRTAVARDGGEALAMLMADPPDAVIPIPGEPEGPVRTHRDDRRPGVRTHLVAPDRAVHGEPRAPVCGMGTCFECRVTIGGRQHQRSCLIPCAPGMIVETGQR